MTNLCSDDSETCSFALKSAQWWMQKTRHREHKTISWFKILRINSISASFLSHTQCLKFEFRDHSARYFWNLLPTPPTTKDTVPGQPLTLSFVQWWIFLRLLPVGLMHDNLVGENISQINLQLQYSPKLLRQILITQLIDLQSSPSPHFNVVWATHIHFCSLIPWEQI